MFLIVVTFGTEFGADVVRNCRQTRRRFFHDLAVKFVAVLGAKFVTELHTELGDEIDVDIFTKGEYVDVTGFSKGKGFQGVVKRHGFRGVGDATHGQHNRLRAPGSIGAASYPARVFKGMRMAGRMGGEKVKVNNLEVLEVIKEKNLLILKGSVPGPINSYITVQK